MIRIVAVLFIAGLALTQQPAHAQDPSPEPDDARYSFNRVEEGFLRLDIRTGQVSLCSRKTVGWTCQVVPDERAVLESEIARVQNDNVALKKELLSRGLSLPGILNREEKSEAPVAKRSDPELRMPSRADLDRMKLFIEKVWRRLVEMIVNFQKDIMQKT